MSASEAPLARYLTVADPHPASGAAILVEPSSSRSQHHTSIVGCTHASLYVQYYTILYLLIHHDTLLVRYISLVYHRTTHINQGKHAVCAYSPVVVPRACGLSRLPESVHMATT